MAKAFLSHSSQQKKNYVEIVARKLGVNNCVYDSFTFEEGMKNLEEIERGMNNSDVFVLFLSDSALNSYWVKKEILESHDRLKNGMIKRIFPLIIDEKINHDDPRIPDWMRDEYNLQYVSRPTVATRRIRQRLIEVSWEFHPSLKAKSNLFVGRNSLIGIFEERIDTFENPSPVALFACGFPNIGRRSYILNALRKTNIIRDSYSFPTITLEIDESIEDFLRKVYDLGFSNNIDLSNLMIKSVDDKITICKELFRDIAKAKEILLIIDDGCVISPGGELSEWFDSVIRDFESENRIYCAIASKYRLFKGGLFKKPYIFSIDIPELDYKERVGLLKRYAEVKKVELDEESIDIIINNLQGFPEQIFFTVDTIKESGLPFLKKNPHIIIEYNSEKVTQILKRYQSNVMAYDFLNLLSQFDFISLDYIYDIVGDEEFYTALIDELNVSAIIEPIGATKEYIRLNDAIRDFVSRSRRTLPKEFQEKIRQHTEDFLKNTVDKTEDVSDYIYSVKDAMVKGLDVPNEYLIPSHFLKSMNDLYDKGKRYSLIVELADRVLVNSSFMDKNIEREIRYMLCVSLARLGDTRFLTEVQKITGPDHHYLFGFYYRISGKSEKAIQSLDKFLELRHSSMKGRRELVQVLIDIEDYERALSYAKINYDVEKLNPYNINPYIRCLLKVRPVDYRKTIEILIENLGKVGTDIGREMYLTATADYYAIFESNETKAMDTINQSIQEFPDNPYPLLSKLEICERFRNINEMERTLKIFRQKNHKANTYTNTTIAFESKLLGLRGDKKSALALIDTKLLGRLPDSTIQKLKQKIQQY